MQKQARSVALLAVVAGVGFFANLGGPQLWDEDEAIFAETAREMMERGDAIVPYFNGELFVHKPPMMYWFMEAGYELFGTNEFAARFWSAVFGIGTVLVTYRLGRLMFSPGVAFWAGIILATNLNFCLIARAATPDAFLTFFSTLAVLAFVSGCAQARAVSTDSSERNAPWVGQTSFAPSWKTYALAYGVMGLGALTKGPIAVLLPTAVIGLFLLVMRAPAGASVLEPGWRGAVRWSIGALGRILSPRHVLATIWSMRPLTALAVVLAVAGPWYIWVGVRTQGEFLIGFFGVHNFGRFLSPMENHRGPIFYYIVAMAAGFFPWSVLAGPTLLDITRQLRRRSPWRAGYVLVGAWVVIWVGFFSLAGTKLPSYIVPAYPALALATATLVDRWLREPALATRFWTRAVWATVALVGVGMLIALPFAARLYLDGQWTLGLIGLVPLVGAAVGCYCSEHGRLRPAMITLSVVSLAFVTAILAWGADYVARYRDIPALARAIAHQTAAGHSPTVAVFHYFRPSFVFYAGPKVHQLDTSDEVEQFFNNHGGDAFLLTTEKGYQALGPQLPHDVTVVETRPRFLRSGRAVLLGRVSAHTATATRAPQAPGGARQ